MNTSSLLTLKAVEDATVISFPEPTQLDALHIRSVGAEFQQLVADGHSRLVVDLTDVAFLSSSALSVFMGLRKSAHAAGGDVVLCCLDEELRKIMKITNLDRMFRFADDCETALEALAVATGAQPPDHG